MRTRSLRFWCPACVGVLVLSGCGIVQSANEISEVSSPPQSTRETQDSRGTVALYWAGYDGPRSYMFREYEQVEPMAAAPAGDVVATSVAMVASRKPRDPDYRNLLHSPTSVGSSVSDDGSLTLNVSSDIFPDHLTPDEAQLAVQQLVYTATGTATNSGISTRGSTTPVTILVDGRTGYHVGDQDLREPVSRDPDAMAPLWIIDPANNVSSGRPVSFKMVASNVADRVSWEIQRDGQRVEHGTVAMSRNESGQHEIQFSRNLDPGDYSVRLYVPNSEVRDKSIVDETQDVSLIDDHDFTVTE